MLNFKKTLTTLVLAGSLLSNTSHADIIISGTRIIYDENKKRMSVSAWKIKVPDRCWCKTGLISGMIMPIQAVLRPHSSPLLPFHV